MTYLDYCLDDPNNDEHRITTNPLEDISFLDFSWVDLIKELHENKGCENYRGMLWRLAEGFRLKPILDVKEVCSSEDQHKHDDQLKNGVANHIAKQGASNQRLVLTIWFPFQDVSRWILSGQGKRC